MTGKLKYIFLLLFSLVTIITSVSIFVKLYSTFNNEVNLTKQSQTVTTQKSPESKAISPAETDNSNLDSSSTLEGFYLDIPDDWKLENSVIHNKDDQKVAELSPGKLTLLKPLSCIDFFDTLNNGETIHAREIDVSSSSSQNILLSEKMQIAENTWHVQVTHTDTHDGISWYPHWFCTKDANTDRLFLITFYDFDEVNVEREDIITTLSSFHFE